MKKVFYCNSCELYFSEQQMIELHDKENIVLICEYCLEKHIKNKKLQTQFETLRKWKGEY